MLDGRLPPQSSDAQPTNRARGSYRGGRGRGVGRGYWSSPAAPAGKGGDKSEKDTATPPPTSESRGGGGGRASLSSPTDQSSSTVAPSDNTTFDTTPSDFDSDNGRAESQQSPPYSMENSPTPSEHYDSPPPSSSSSSSSSPPSNSENPAPSALASRASSVETARQVKDSPPPLDTAYQSRVQQLIEDQNAQIGQLRGEVDRLFAFRRNNNVNIDCAAAPTSAVSPPSLPTLGGGAAARPETALVGQLRRVLRDLSVNMESRTAAATSSSLEGAGADWMSAGDAASLAQELRLCQELLKEEVGRRSRVAAELERCESRNGELRTELVQLGARLQAARTQRTQLSAELQTMRRQLTDLTATLEREREENARAPAKTETVLKLEAQVQMLERKLHESNLQLAESAERARVREDLHQQQQERLSSEIEQLKVANAADATRRLVEVERAKEEARVAVAGRIEVAQELDTLRQTYEKSRESIRQAEIAAESLRIAQDELAKLREENSRLRSAEAAARREASKALREVEASTKEKLAQLEGELSRVRDEESKRRQEAERLVQEEQAQKTQLLGELRQLKDEALRVAEVSQEQVAKEQAIQQGLLDKLRRLQAMHETEVSTSLALRESLRQLQETLDEEQSRRAELEEQRQLSAYGNALPGARASELRGENELLWSRLDEAQTREQELSDKIEALEMELAQLQNTDAGRWAQLLKEARAEVADLRPRQQEHHRHESTGGNSTLSSMDGERSRQHTIEMLRKELASTRHSYNNMELSLKATQAHLDSEIGRREQREAELTEQLAAKDSRLAEVEAQLAEAQAELKEASETAGVAHEEVQRLKEDATKIDETLVEERQRAQDLADRLQAQVAQLVEAENREAELIATVKRLEAEVQQLKEDAAAAAAAVVERGPMTVCPAEASLTIESEESASPETQVEFFDVAQVRATPSVCPAVTAVFIEGAEEDLGAVTVRPAIEEETPSALFEELEKLKSRLTEKEAAIEAAEAAAEALRAELDHQKEEAGLERARLEQELEEAEGRRSRAEEAEAALKASTTDLKARLAEVSMTLTTKPVMANAGVATGVVYWQDIETPPTEAERLAAHLRAAFVFFLEELTKLRKIVVPNYEAIKHKPLTALSPSSGRGGVGRSTPGQVFLSQMQRDFLAQLAEFESVTLPEVSLSFSWLPAENKVLKGRDLFIEVGRLEHLTTAHKSHIKNLEQQLEAAKAQMTKIEAGWQEEYAFYKARQGRLEADIADKNEQLVKLRKALELSNKKARVQADTSPVVLTPDPVVVAPASPQRKSRAGGAESEVRLLEAKIAQLKQERDLALKEQKEAHEVEMLLQRELKARRPDTELIVRERFNIGVACLAMGFVCGVVFV